MRNLAILFALALVLFAAVPAEAGGYGTQATFVQSGVFQQQCQPAVLATGFGTAVFFQPTNAVFTQSAFVHGSGFGATVVEVERRRPRPVVIRINR